MSKPSKLTAMQAEPTEVEPKPFEPPSELPCRICAGGLGGVAKLGAQYPKNGKLRVVFKCATCGHDWTEDFETGEPQTTQQAISVERRPDGREFLAD